MYTRYYWDLLIVDDDQDVLSVTKLALKGVKVYGIPLKITTCGSKAEAMEHLRNPSVVPNLSLAIIDVVMETPHAGLELCGYIRNELHNRVTPLIVRTGQAGLVPEQKVMDDYDITAYITKVEATDERLSTLVKSSLRNFLYSRSTAATAAWAHRVIESSRSRKDLLASMQKCLLSGIMGRDGKRLEPLDGHMAFLIEGQGVGIGKLEDQDVARKLDEQLAGEKAQDFAPGTYVHIGDRVRLHLDADDRFPAVTFVAETNFDPIPEFFVRGWIYDMRIFRGLWALMG